MADERLVLRLNTPDPEEFSLRVWVPPDKFADSKKPTTGVTRYADFLMHPAVSRMAECDDYVYTYAEATREDGFMPFHFARLKTAEELRTPFDSHIDRMGNHRWADMLMGLAVVPDHTFPRSANIIRNGAQGLVTGPSYRIAEALIPEMTEGTRFLMQEFIGHDWFTIPRYRVPTPGSVNLSLPGGESYRIGECYHDDVEIPALSAANATFISGTASAFGGMIGAQKFPATRPKRWRPYWFSDQQVRRDGVIYRWRIRVFPPWVPELTLSLN